MSFRVLIREAGLTLFASLFLFSGVILSCSTEIEPVNPFDPAAPKELQRNIKVIEWNTRALIRWNPSPSGDVKGYKLYYGPALDMYNETFAT